MIPENEGKIKERGKGCEIFLAPLFFMYYNHNKYAILRMMKLCHIQRYTGNGAHIPSTM